MVASLGLQRHPDRTTGRRLGQRLADMAYGGRNCQLDGQFEPLAAAGLANVGRIIRLTTGLGLQPPILGLGQQGLGKLCIRQTAVE